MKKIKKAIVLLLAITILTLPAHVITHSITANCENAFYEFTPNYMDDKYVVK